MTIGSLRPSTDEGWPVVMVVVGVSLGKILDDVVVITRVTIAVVVVVVDVVVFTSGGEQVRIGDGETDIIGRRSSARR